MSIFPYDNFSMVRLGLFMHRRLLDAARGGYGVEHCSEDMASESCTAARTQGIVGRALRLRKAMEPCAAANRSLEVYISHRKKIYSV